MGIVAVAHHFQNDVKEAEFEGVAAVAVGSRQQERICSFDERARAHT